MLSAMACSFVFTRQSGQPVTLPLFSRTLKAVQCALRQVASVMVVVRSVPPAVRPAMIRAARTP